MNINRLIVFIVVALVVVGAAIYYTNNNELPEIDLNPAPVVQEEPNMDNIDNSIEGLQIEDVKVGTGVEAAVNDDITVHYVGTLDDGTVFDSSRERGEPVTFGLVPGGLIEGWIKGIPGMKEGGVRNLTIAPELGYGNNQAGTIPPGSTLHFEVELIKVEKK